MSNRIRLGTCSVEEFLNEYRSIKDSARFTVCEHSLKGNSLRYKAFNKSLYCAKCEIGISFFAFEKEEKDTHCHANAYGYDKDRNEILFTIDHIIPKSRGGGNHPLNLQTMCYTCNAEKADTLDENLFNFKLKKSDLNLIYNLLTKRIKEPEHSEEYKKKIRNIIKKFDKFR